MRRQVIKILSNILALYLGTILLTQVSAAAYREIIIGGIVLWLANLVVKPILTLITIPVNLLTLGLFSLVINTWMVMLAGRLVEGLNTGGFITAFMLAVLVSVTNMILYKLLKKDKK